LCGPLAQVENGDDLATSSVASAPQNPEELLAWAMVSPKDRAAKEAKDKAEREASKLTWIEVSGAASLFARHSLHTN